MAKNDGHLPAYQSLPFAMRFLPSLPRYVIEPIDKAGGFPLRLETIGLRNCFSVIVGPSFNVVDVINDFPLPYDRTEIPALINDIFAEEQPWGRLGGIHFLIVQKENGMQMVCIGDLQNELLAFRHLMMYSAEILLVAILIVSIASWFFADLILTPSIEAYYRQKAFISNAGHELKTPISVIGANVDVLLADYPDNKWLQYIRVENQRMGQLVKDLLYLARSDADRSPLEMCPFDFSSTVENAALLFEGIMLEQEKKLELFISSGLTCVGDESQLKQVVMILVDNAIKNSERGAVIRVSVFAEGKKLIIKVYNEGQGIRKENFSQIFERFYRGDESRARNTGGYGLGLPIALTIVQAHKGTISVASKYGEWAEFTVAIPRW
ncbi:MAG: HAMP domain-containing histidine kinase, partial [Treponema sp.]|nr:HAMP domain-containing histidine kinase [Treponema sp.]